MDEIRVIQFGLGPIGCSVARLIHQRAGLQLVGAVDIDSAKVGLDAGTVIGLDQKLGFPVVESIAGVSSPAEVVTHSTNSTFQLFEDQIMQLLEAGCDIVSTSEELSFPWMYNKQEAQRLDEKAKQAGKTVLGTGINPGFIMDSFVIFLTSICASVERIEVKRVINASHRRGPFQKKIGAGMTVTEFNSNMAAGQMGHVGLPQSVAMVFDSFGKALTRYEDEVEPLIADTQIKTDHYLVEPGEVHGLKQVARGFSGELEFIKLIFIAALDAEEDGDTITITGSPDLQVHLKGTNGDIATVAIMVNAIPKVIASPPGLLTMIDIPTIGAW